MALAASHDNFAEKFIPADIAVVYQLNTEEANPLEESLTWAFMAEIYGADTAILPEADMEALINDNIFTFAMTAAEDPDFYIGLYVKPDDFDTILTELKTQYVIKEIEYRGYDMYINEYDTAFAYIDDELLLICNGSEKLKTALYGQNSLASNADYKEVSAKDVTNSFFKMYINPSFFATEMGEELALSGMTGLNTNILSAMKAESIAVTQTDEGFEGSATVKGDEQKLLALNLLFNKYNFTPELYKLISGEDLIVYGETMNLKSKIDDLFTTLELTEEDIASINELKAEFKTETEIDIDTEILPLLSQRTMLTVHNSGVMIPGITVIVETGTGNTNIAKGMIAKMAAYMETQGFDSGTLQIAGTDFFDMKLTNTEGTGEILYVRMGVTSDGYLVISTAPNLIDIFRKDAEGIMADSSVSGALKTLSENLSGVSFFSSDNLQDYLNILFKEDDEMLENINIILDPWHEIFSKEYAETDLTWGSIKAIVDTAGFEKYGPVFEEWSESFSEQYLEPTFAPKSFCDVPEGSWYHEYVIDLSSNGVITGYEDGCFRPENPITRAEFITLLMKATNSAASITTGYKPFSDVPPMWETWYSEYVNMGAYMNYVTGYPDGTFRPNANITRGEAMQIVYNMSTKLPLINSLDTPLASMNAFGDINENDWYFTPVVAARHYGLVNGVTSTVFEPNRNITRAEAAKIVKLFLELENQ